MAEKQNKPDPQLGMIVAELRKLNAVSKKDLIREKEVADRQERMALAAEVGEEQQATIIDGAQDFQRRFLAGQAKTFVDKGKIGPGDENKKPATRGNQEIFMKMFEDRWKALDSDKDEADRENKDDDKKAAKGPKKVKDKPKGDDGKGVSLLKGAAKAAGGMALLGLGIGGFMSGLMVWSNIKEFKGEGFPDQAKNVADGLEHIGGMSNKSIATLGVMLAGGAFLGMAGGVGKSSKAAIGMTAMGAGIGGFMTGIVAAGDLTGFKGDTFAAQAENVANALGSLSALTEAQVATLGVVAAGGVLIAAKPSLKGFKGIELAGKAALGASIGGAAIGGFMTGIAAPGDISKFKGTAFKDQAKNTVEAIDALSTLTTPTLTTLGLIAAAGAVMGAGPAGKGGVATAAKAALGASVMGAGIGGFMVGIASAAELGEMAGADGTAFKTQATNIAEGLGAFTPLQQKALAGFIVAGAGLGQSIIGSGLALGGMTAMGAGIGGFFAGLTGATDLAAFAGADGSGIKQMMVNMGGGLESFNDVDGTNLGSVGDGLLDLGLGIAGLGTALFGTGVADTAGDVVDGVKNFFNWEWLSGKKDKDTSASGIETLITSIVEPMKKLAEVDSDTYNQAASGIQSIVTALNAYNGLKIQTGPRLGELADDFVLGAHAIDVAMNGGKYKKPGLFNDLEVTNGLKNLSALEFNTVSNGIRVLQEAMLSYNNATAGTMSTGGSNNIINNVDSSSSTTIIQSSESPDFSVGDGISQGAWPGGRELPAGGLRMGY